MSDAPIDFNHHRVERAKSAADITPVMALREVLRKIEAGELSPTNIIVACLSEDEDGTWIDNFTGGPGSRCEHVGMLYRATNLMVTGS